MVHNQGGGVFEVDSANDEENLIKIKIINFSSNKEQKNNMVQTFMNKD